jgi:hypothetical protein
MSLRRTLLISCEVYDFTMSKDKLLLSAVLLLHRLRFPMPHYCRIRLYIFVYVWGYLAWAKILFLFIFVVLLSWFDKIHFGWSVIYRAGVFHRSCAMLNFEMQRTRGVLFLHVQFFGNSYGSITLLASVWLLDQRMKWRDCLTYFVGPHLSWFVCRGHHLRCGYINKNLIRFLRR